VGFSFYVNFDSKDLGERFKRRCVELKMDLSGKRKKFFSPYDSINWIKGSRKMSRGLTR
jgi:hypothetical protein